MTILTVILFNCFRSVYAFVAENTSSCFNYINVRHLDLPLLPFAFPFFLL